MTNGGHQQQMLDCDNEGETGEGLDCFSIGDKGSATAAVAIKDFGSSAEFPTLVKEALASSCSFGITFVVDWLADGEDDHSRELCEFVRSSRPLFDFGGPLGLSQPLR